MSLYGHAVQYLEHCTKWRFHATLVPAAVQMDCFREGVQEHVLHQKPQLGTHLLRKEQENNIGSGFIHHDRASKYMIILGLRPSLNQGGGHCNYNIYIYLKVA